MHLPWLPLTKRGGKPSFKLDIKLLANGQDAHERSGVLVSDPFRLDANGHLHYAGLYPGFISLNLWPLP